jgi:hypothetical protein
MQKRDAEFCNFREIRALIFTWNAGASKPSDLKRGSEEERLFRGIFNQEKPPEIIVFGFQELVDLENKKVTASKSSTSCRVQYRVLTHEQRASLWEEARKIKTPAIRNI